MPSHGPTEPPYEDYGWSDEYDKIMETPEARDLLKDLFRSVKPRESMAIATRHPDDFHGVETDDEPMQAFVRLVYDRGIAYGYGNEMLDRGMVELDEEIRLQDLVLDQADAVDFEDAPVIVAPPDEPWMRGVVVLADGTELDLGDDAHGYVSLIRRDYAGEILGRSLAGLGNDKVEAELEEEQRAMGHARVMLITCEDPFGGRRPPPTKVRAAAVLQGRVNDGLSVVPVLRPGDALNATEDKG